MEEEKAIVVEQEAVAKKDEQEAVEKKAAAQVIEEDFVVSKKEDAARDSKFIIIAIVAIAVNRNESTVVAKYEKVSKREGETVKFEKGREAIKIENVIIAVKAKGDVVDIGKAVVTIENKEVGGEHDINEKAENKADKNDAGTFEDSVILNSRNCLRFKKEEHHSIIDVNLEKEGQSVIEKQLHS